MDSNDPQTVTDGLKKRLFRDVPLAQGVLIDDLRRFVRKYCAENFAVARNISFQEWLGGTHYSDPRKKELAESNERNHGGPPNRKARRKINMFVKREFYMEWKHARLINSRSDQFKAWSGRFFKAVEEVVFAKPYFVKHVPVDQRAELIRSMRRSLAHYYATDFTAYESHFVPEIMDAVECELYRWCLQWSPDVEILCSTLCGINRMKARMGSSAQCTGRRMSGDMCTSLGNGFTNFILATYLATKKGGTIHGFFEGDDGLFSSDVVLTKEDYEALGFTIKIEEVSDPCAASFCGMIFAESGEVIRDPRKFLMGFGWTSSCVGAGRSVGWQLLKAKSLSAIYETPQCPIVGELSRMALGRCEAQGVTARFVDDGYHKRPLLGPGLPTFHPSLSTRALFQEHFGISISAQLAAESAIRDGHFDELHLIVPPTGPQIAYSQLYVEVT